MGRKKQAKSGRSREQSKLEGHPDRAYDAFDKILELTSDFCRKYLTEEYRELCEDLTWAVYEKGLPVEKGRPASWASGIVHALGFVNFLHDPSQSPHMTSPQIAKGFGVSQGTMQGKSKIIRDELELMPFDPDWCLPSLLQDNPLVWMLEVNGLVMDIRTAPREAQEEAYRLGLIPFIPADRPEPEKQPDTRTKIIQFPSGQSRLAGPRSAQQQKDAGPTLFDGLQE
ncbi:MAG: DUF6398 domain-containing protein [Planctomycetota bacterium]|jgi:hypothetical protein